MSILRTDFLAASNSKNFNWIVDLLAFSPPPNTFFISNSFTKIKMIEEKKFLFLRYVYDAMDLLLLAYVVLWWIFCLRTKTLL